MDVRRRNGLSASCEPCRKRKIACDHRRPACGRCERRGDALRCVYHPSPMTSRPLKLPSERKKRPSLRPATPQPSFEEAETAAAPPEHTAPYLSDDVRLQQVQAILRLLRHFDRIHELLRNYYAVSQGPIVPGIIVFAVLDHLKKTTLLRQSLLHNSQDDSRLVSYAQATLKTTSAAITVSSTTSVDAFCGFLCGEAIRLEALGIVYSVAARACKFATRKGDASCDDFISDLYTSSLECRQIARDTAPMNDALLWLTYENTILTSYMHGDSSELVWRRIDHLSGDVLALGVHRDSFNTLNTPPFLSELRRRAFHKAYGLDVYLAALFDRPSRLSKRHSNCALPLDLPDEEVCTDGKPTSEASRLSSEGWNMSGRTNCATWIRTRSLFSSVKEEIAECMYLPAAAETRSRLCTLSWRLNDVWNALPPHLCEIPTHSSPDVTALSLLTLTRLKFLQSDMQIHAMLKQQGQSSYAWEPSLRAAAEVMSHVLRLGSVPDNDNLLMLDFPDIVVNFGLGSAGVIATSLQDLATNRAQRLPNGLSRATLIRNMLTFISHLENLSSESYHAASTAFAEAAKTLSRAVDDVLDPQPGPVNHVEAVPNRSLGQLSETTGSSFEPPSTATTATDTTLLSANALDDLGLNAWLTTLDWNGTADSWIDF